MQIHPDRGPHSTNPPAPLPHWRPLAVCCYRPSRILPLPLSSLTHAPDLISCPLTAVATPRHWQLRSLIGIDPQNHIYFPVSGPDGKSYHVQRLNTKTRETETVKRLSFNPRCLVARNGWVCCGGEHGIFSAFRVGGGGATPDDHASRLDFRVDGRLPLSMDLTEDVLTSLAAAHYEKSLVAQSIDFGKARVNCITVWSPPSLVNPVDGAYDQDVAVLAHNDSSVIVVSLREQEALDKVTYPDYMNRGVISPDGGLLIAISDDPYLHVHERREKKSELGNAVRVGDRPAYEWGLCGKLQLKSQSKDDRSDNRFLLQPPPPYYCGHAKR